MEFSGQYLTYEDYKGLGGTLNLTPFNLLEFEARRRIDIRTQNRLKNVDNKDIPQEVKICEYKLIERMSSYDETLNEVAEKGNIASESTDGYSVSFISGNQINEVIKSKNDELDNVIREYLLLVVFNGEHLMYCGVE